MPKVGVEPIRRAEVINATLMCICEYGIDSTTLDKVAHQAGCSKGVVAYYFKNKNTLILEAFKAFLGYYGKKIQGDIKPKMTASEMLEVTLFHSLPPQGLLENQGVSPINVSDLNGIDQMALSPSQKATLFLQFFSKAAVDVDLQKVVAETYTKDVEGIASIFHFGRVTGEFGDGHDEDENQKSAYGLLAMVLGLSFFRVADFSIACLKEDNREVALDYAQRLKKGHSYYKK